MEFLELGASPSDENCVQVDSNGDYHDAMREELKRYKSMLYARFPIPKNVRAWFTVKWFPHDFGSYGEVCIVYDDYDKLSSEFAYHVEDNLPDTWDDTSLIRFVVRTIE